MGPTPHPPAWAPCVSVSRPWVQAGAGRTGVPPGPSPGTVTNAEQTAVGVPKPGQGRAWKCTFCRNFRGSLPDCVAGLPGPFHLERGMSLSSCSFHTSGPGVVIPVHPLSPPRPPWTVLPALGQESWQEPRGHFLLCEDACPHQHRSGQSCVHFLGGEDQGRDLPSGVPGSGGSRCPL